MTNTTSGSLARVITLPGVTALTDRPAANRPAARPRKPLRRHPEHVIAGAVAALQDVYAATGRLTKADYREQAERCDVVVRTVENWWAAHLRRQQETAAGTGPTVRAPHEPRELPGRRRKFTFDVEHYPYFAGVSIADAYYEMLADGVIPPMHYHTFRRTYRSQVPLTIQKGLAYGEKVMPEQWVYPPGPATALGKVYTTDVMYPRIQTAHQADLDAGRLTPLPDVTFMVVRDAATTLPLAWCLFDHVPTAREVTALVGQAVRGYTTDGVFCGGVPDRLRVDNGSNLVADELREHLFGIRTIVDPTNSYSSWENGGHERMHRIIRNEALADLPGHTDGPVTKAGSLYVVPGVDPVPFTVLAQRLDAWARSYAFERTQDQLGSRTPFEAWTERVATEPVTRASAEALAHLAMPVGTSTINKRGVTVPFHGAGTTYFLPDLTTAPTRQVNVRVWLTDPSTVELFLPDGTYLGAAGLTSQVSHTDHVKALAQRSGSLKSVADSQREAARRRKLRTTGTATAAPAGHATQRTLAAHEAIEAIGAAEPAPVSSEQNGPDTAVNNKRKASKKTTKKSGRNTTTTAPAAAADEQADWMSTLADRL